MKREIPEKSDENVEELQSELTRLQRQFCLLEDDRRRYKEETEHTLRKQKETISTLQFEHEDLTKDIKLSGSLTNQISDANNTTTLRQLLDDEDEAKRISEAQHVKSNNVNEEIKILMQKMDIHRKKLGGRQESERKCKAMIKSKRVMEDRLNEANIKYNIALGRNNSLRQEIDHVNAQRKRFQDLHHKLSTMFNTGKEEKNSLIDNANALFSSREEAQNRMQLIRERSDRDKTMFYAELRDLQRIIDHDQHLRDFMSTKLEERAELFEAIIQGRREKKLSDRMNVLQNEIENYEDIFKRLKEVTDINDTNELVESFINVEDKNFALFNFIKEQTQSIQKNELTVKELQEKITKIEKEEIVVGHKHKEIFETLTEKETEQTNREKNVSLQLKNDRNELEKIKQFLDQMLKNTQCNRNKMMELGGSNITNENIMCYLGLIEQRAGELAQAKLLLAIKNEMENTSENKEGKVRITFPTVGLIARCIVAPPSFSSEIPVAPVATPPSADFARPFSQLEARSAAINLAKGERERKMAESFGIKK